MRLGYARVGKGPAPLARQHRRVDPALHKEPLGNGGHLRREGGKGREHDLAALVPADLSLLAAGHRRVAVVVEQLVHAKQLPLAGIVAVGDIVPRGDRGHQGVHGAVLEFVGQVAGSDPGWIAPQPVVDHLLRRERVEDVGEQMEVFTQTRGQFVSPAPAHSPVRVMKVAEHLFLGAAVHAEAQMPEQFVEQQVPGTAAHRAEFLEEFLLRAAQLVRSELAQGAQVMAIPLEFRLAEQVFGPGRVETVPFQGEKHGLPAHPGGEFLHLLEQGRGGRVPGLGDKVEKGEGLEPGEQAVHLFQVADQPVERSCIEFCHPAGKACGQLHRGRMAAVQVAADFRCVRRRVEGAQVPENLGGAELCCGVGGHGSVPDGCRSDGRNRGGTWRWAARAHSAASRRRRDRAGSGGRLRRGRAIRR